MINLGRVGLVLKGEWSSGVDCVELDLFTYGGNRFVCKKSHTNSQIPPNESEYFESWSSAGATEELSYGDRLKLNSHWKKLWVPKAATKCLYGYFLDADIFFRASKWHIRNRIFDMRDGVLDAKGEIEVICKKEKNLCYIRLIGEEFFTPIIEEEFPDGTFTLGPIPLYEEIEIYSELGAEPLYYIDENGIENEV